MRITHRVGHALTTRGKQSPDGVKEWAQAEPIAKLVIAELNNYEGVAQKRVDDPTGKVDKSLKTLIAEVNDFKADVHIDYHLNAHGDGTTWTSGHGTEVFVNTRKPKEAVELATKVLNNIVSVTGFRNRGVKYYNWDMVNFPKATNILVEICFMTNKDDVSIVRSTDGQIKIAAAIVEAIVSQYNLKRKGSKNTKDKKVVQSKVAGVTSRPKANLRVDGYLGPATISALQRYFGTIVDGKISRPSLVIKAMQKWLGTPQDGVISTPSLMVKALQKRFGTPVDGIISKPSLVIKELQRRLNKGDLG